MQKAGYTLIAAFTLPETCWTDHYLKENKAAQERFLAKYRGNTFVEDFVAGQRKELEMFERFKAYYGYTFFVGRK